MKPFAPDDLFTHFNGVYQPSIKIVVNEDRGAVPGFYRIVQGGFHPVAWSLCSGASSVPTGTYRYDEITCDFAASSNKELNGGRPF